MTSIFEMISSSPEDTAKIDEIEEKVIKAVTVRLFADNALPKFYQEVLAHFDTSNDIDLTSLMASGFIETLLRKLSPDDPQGLWQKTILAYYMAKI